MTGLTYDAAGRLTAVHNTAIQAGALEAHAYTDNGREASFTDARGNTTSYTYDGFDRPVTTTYPGSSTETVTYNAVGNILTATNRAGQTTTLAYDALNRLTTKTPPSPEPVVTYTYDATGRVLGIDDNSAAITGVANPPGTTGIAFIRDHAYDALNRRTGVTWDNANAQATPTYATVTFDHAYNKVNQRTYQAVDDNSFWHTPPVAASTVSYTANNLNQYSAVGAVTPTYDGKGNLTNDGTFTFTYDSANRLLTATDGVTVSGYAYDSRGRRKSKTVNGVTTHYISDPADREVLEYDGGTGQILRHYAHGNGIDEALNQIALSGDRQTLIPDIQGSVIASLGSATGAMSKTGYRVFGQSASNSGSYRYTGRRIDAETNGLYYYRARMYSPAWGRFLQPDPIGYAGGPNLYAYVGNDPMNAVDPLGLLTLQVGGSYYLNLGAISFSFSGGIITDGYGNAGFYATGHTGPAVGTGGFKIAANVAVSDAPRIHDLAGIGAAGSAFVGAGPAISYDRGSGRTRTGEDYNSYGGALGFGTGAAISAGPSYTFVKPMVEFDRGAASTTNEPTYSFDHSISLSSTPSPGYDVYNPSLFDSAGSYSGGGGSYK